MIISELVTNAVKIAPGDQIQFGIALDRETGLVVWCQDSSNQLPEIRAADDALATDTFEDGGGRGLHVVSALASSGPHWELLIEGGKMVWAVL
jgi:two-component sensor histidine kinase